MIDKIEDFELTTLTEPKYITPKLATYKQNGISKTWELIQSHNSVAVLLYHKEHDTFIFVKQFRPPVYHNNGNGITLELCAGLVDKDKSIQEIAKEEIEEECGYLVEVDAIEKITAFHTAVGHSGGKQFLFYCEVDESMHISQGGGIDTEMIEVIEMSIEEAIQMLFDESIIKTPGLIFAIYWWSNTIKEKIIPKAKP
ncbi:MAG: NUDIX domain-containing protein [Campylobacterales bacterium]|nr:NUDIX domain-containing protein [Campylobacterales bacterium]